MGTSSGNIPAGGRAPGLQQVDGDTSVAQIAGHNPDSASLPVAAGDLACGQLAGSLTEPAARTFGSGGHAMACPMVAVMIRRGRCSAVFPDAMRRWLYRRRRAGRLAGLLNGAQARLAAAGIGPGWLVMVEVTGRRTGRTISFPAVIADYDGGRYLVSMLGEDTSWVRNVRASGGHAVLRHGNREAVMLEEVEPGRRAPILRCYLQRAAGARAHIPVDHRAPVEAFEPVAARYPVFRVMAVGEAARR